MQKQRKGVMDKMLFQIQVPLLCHSEQLLFHPYHEDNGLIPKRKKKKGGGIRPWGTTPVPIQAVFIYWNYQKTAFFLVLSRQRTTEKKITIINQKVNKHNTCTKTRKV